MKSLLLLCICVAVVHGAEGTLDAEQYYFEEAVRYDAPIERSKWCWNAENEDRNTASAVHYGYEIRIVGEVWPLDLHLVTVTPANLADWLQRVIPRSIDYESLDLLPAGRVDKKFLVSDAKEVCAGLYNPHNETVGFRLDVSFAIVNQPYIDATVTLGVLLAVILLGNIVLLYHWKAPSTHTDAKKTFKPLKEEDCNT